MANLTAAQRTELVELYVAYFNRAPDAAGLSYWSNKIANDGWTVAKVAGSFMDQAEVMAAYPSYATTAETVEKVYMNVLNRAPDAAGAAYWAADLTSGKVSRPDFIMAIVNAAKSATGTVADAAVLSNKAAVGEYFAVTQNLNDIAQARSVMTGVTADPASATAAKATIDAYAGVANAVQLTSGVDVATGTSFVANQTYTPGGTDRINSLQDNDKLTGTSATTDKLTATIGSNADTGDTVIMPTMSGVEVVNVAFDATDYSLDMQDTAGVTEVNFTRMESGATNGALRMTSVPTTMSVSNSSATATNATFTFNNTTATGTADVATLKLSNASVLNVNIGDDAVKTIDGVEILTVNSVGATNTVGTLNATDVRTLNITGDKALTIGTIKDANTNGQFVAIDGSTATGNLTLSIDTALDADMSAFNGTGTAVNFSMKTGSGNDIINITTDSLVGNAADSVDAGTGSDTAAIAQATTNTVTSATSASFAGFEAVTVTRTTGAGVALTNITVGMDRFTGDQTIKLTNTGDANDGFATFILNQLSAVEAGQITIAHSNDTNNAIGDNLVVANLATATGTTDTVAITVVDGTNSEARFNFGVTAAAVENFTVTDSDTETNTIQLNSVAAHTGTVTIAGGTAGTTMNLDTNGVNGGIYGLDVSGTATDLAGAVDGAGNQALVAATVTAAGYAGNAVVRVSSNAANANGAQSITMGSGNDTVVFDNAADFRAGLTISDTVAGGAGSDTLAIDGTVAVTLGASEWTNVTGFETIKTVGTGVSYNLTLTDALITNNAADGAKINIVNDNDTANDTGAAAGTADTVGTSAESAITVDARGLSSTKSFTYNGEEGASRTNDRFIFADQNINGNAVINGGAIDNDTDNRGTDAAATTTVVEGNATVANTGNGDIIEVRNAAVVSTGDLAGVSNVGQIQFTNDLAVTQSSALQLNDTIVDMMVDSYQASASRALTSGQNVEVLQVSALDNVNVAAATTGMTIEAGTLTDKSDTSILLGRGANNIATGAGQDSVTLLGNYVAGTYAANVNGIALNDYSTATAAVRVVTDTINLGAGTDTLTTYGAINLAGATLTGIENIVANSDVIILASQLIGKSVTFNSTAGDASHNVILVNDLATGQSLNLANITAGSGTTALNVTLVNDSVGTATGGIYGTVTNNATATLTTGPVVQTSTSTVSSLSNVQALNFETAAATKVVTVATIPTTVVEVTGVTGGTNGSGSLLM